MAGIVARRDMLGTPAPEDLREARSLARAAASKVARDASPLAAAGHLLTLTDLGFADDPAAARAAAIIARHIDRAAPILAASADAEAAPASTPLGEPRTSASAVRLAGFTWGLRGLVSSGHHPDAADHAVIALMGLLDGHHPDIPRTWEPGTWCCPTCTVDILAALARTAEPVPEYELGVAHFRRTVLPDGTVPRASVFAVADIAGGRSGPSEQALLAAIYPALARAQNADGSFRRGRGHAGEARTLAVARAFQNQGVFDAAPPRDPV